MPAHRIALVVSLLPLITIHCSFLVAASFEHVKWCFPYGMDCTSISATGRQTPESWIFKPLMTLSAAFMLLYWHLCVNYLHLLQCKAPKRIVAIRVLGFLAPLFLVLYTTFLGEQGEQYGELRRIGITFSFTFTYLCQLMFTSCLLQASSVSRTIAFAQRINWLVLFLGILSLVLDLVLGKQYDRMENGFEWSFALLMGIHALCIALEWRSKRYRLNYLTGEH